MISNRQKLAVAQRALQLNVLVSKVTAEIEAAGIAIIAGGKRARQNFNAIPGASRWRIRARRSFPVVRQSQAAGDGNASSGGFDLIQINFISHAPWQLEWIAAQAPSPAQGCIRIQLSGLDQSAGKIRRLGRAFQIRGGHAQR